MDVDVFGEATPAAIEFGSHAPANFAAQHHGSQELVARRYMQRGYTSTRLSTRHEDAVTVCSATQGERVVGTIAVRFQSENGLNAEKCFPDEVAALRAQGLMICEFSRLALDEDVCDNKRLLARLFHLAYLHGHRLGGCDTLVIEVNPRHVSFYRRMLGFEVRSGVRTNACVDAPAVLMSLDMVAGRERIAAMGGQPELASTTRTLFPFFYSAVEEEALLNRLRQ